MDLENLTKVNGHSYQDILQTMVDNGLYHHVGSDGRQAHSHEKPFVRKSVIATNRKGYRELAELIGPGKDIGRGTYRYFAEYQIDEDFDLTRLHGTFTFRKGKVVEAIDILTW